MRTNKIIDATIDEIENAKETVVSLMLNSGAQNPLDLFYTTDLEEIELAFIVYFVIYSCI